MPCAVARCGKDRKRERRETARGEREREREERKHTIGEWDAVWRDGDDEGALRDREVAVVERNSVHAQKHLASSCT